MKFSIKERFEKINYTLKHKKAFLEVEKSFAEKTHGAVICTIWTSRFYICFALVLIKKIFRSFTAHTIAISRKFSKKNREDLLDAVIDWECARMTKPDKPLNAYDTLMKFYPEHESEFLPIIKEYLPEQIREKN